MNLDELQKRSYGEISFHLETTDATCKREIIFLEKNYFKGGEIRN